MSSKKTYYAWKQYKNVKMCAMTVPRPYTLMKVHLLELHHEARNVPAGHAPQELDLVGM